MLTNQTEDGGKLSPKQKAFADYYILTKNATEAAKKAGYSEKTAGVIGFENLKKPKISAYIKKRLDEIEKERIASIEEVMRFYTATMRNKLEDIEDDDDKPTITERLKAADRIMERLTLLEERDGDEDNEERGVIILPEVKTE